MHSRLTVEERSSSCLLFKTDGISMLFCTLDRFQRRKMEILIGCRDKEKAAKYFKNITKNMFFFYQKESNKE